MINVVAPESTGAVTGIISAIEDLLEAAGLELEDLSSIDTSTWSGNPVAQLLYNGEDFEEHINQPETATIRFDIELQYRKNTPTAARTTAYTWVHTLKDNITAANINLSDKLVRNVLHTGAEINYDDSPIIKITHKIEVRYRNDD